MDTLITIEDSSEKQIIFDPCTELLAPENWFRSDFGYHSFVLSNWTPESVLPNIEVHYGPRAVQIPIFTELFCSNLVFELERMSLQCQDVKLEESGINLLEFGYSDFLCKMVDILLPLIKRKFPAYVGFGGMEGCSMRAIKYPTGSFMSAPVTDNSTITISLALNSEYKGGQLCIGSPTGVFAISQEKGQAVIYPGRVKYLNSAVEQGVKYSLVMWLKRKDEFHKFFDLPQSIQYDILSNLDLVDILNLSLTCNYCYNLSKEEELWKCMYEKRVNYFRSILMGSSVYKEPVEGHRREWYKSMTLAIREVRKKRAERTSKRPKIQ